MEEKPLQMIAKTVHGLEKVLAEELRAIGAKEILPIRRGVRFTGDKEVLYKANFYCRTSLRILVEIFSFRARYEDQLYTNIRKFDWSTLIGTDNTIAVNAVTNSPIFSHSKYASLKVKDAIVDQFRDKTGARPSVNPTKPDLRIHLHIQHDDCSVSLDSSGDSLHRRGYRQGQNAAPLSEVLAAGMILLSGWDGKGNFVDPMCGSGTILSEAVMISANMPAGTYRKEYGFLRWHDYDQELWERIRGEGEAAIRKPQCTLFGSDKSPIAMRVTQRNFEFMGFYDLLTLRKIPFDRLKGPEGGGVLITNPPYGERMELEDIVAFYSMMGDSLKQNFTGYKAWILSANPTGMKSIGLAADERIVLFNGPLECRYHGFDIYEGKLEEEKE